MFLRNFLDVQWSSYKAGSIVFPATLHSSIANYFYHEADCWYVTDREELDAYCKMLCNVIGEVLILA
jgi:hypothetical protein